MKQRQAVVLPPKTPITKLRISIVDENGEGDQWTPEEFGAEVVTLTRQPGRDSLGATGQYVWVSKGEPTP